VRPTYKWPFRVELSEWGGLTIDQVAHCLELELRCEVARPYVPLTNSPLYQPHSDPARRIGADYWGRIDPARYRCPNADAFYATVLLIEHAAGLDPRFPEAFVEAVLKIQSNARAIAAALKD
ncbi:MAG: hypothetical protein ABIZ50_01070, partial [Solirubrobacterales bacterium]